MKNKVKTPVAKATKCLVILCDYKHPKLNRRRFT